MRIWYIRSVAKKIVTSLLIGVGLLLIGWGVWRFIQSRKPNAGLKVQTNPVSLVFVDNVQVGQTPLEKVYRPGEISLKVIPTATDSAMASYQTKVQLNAQTFTVIRRDFGPTEAQTAGEIITLEQQQNKQASLSIISSIPDAASVTLDGQPQGFTEVWIPSTTPGDHQIVVSAPGFVTRTISAKTVAGHKLIINVKLAAQLDIAPTPTPEVAATVSATPKVSPKTTPSPSVTKTPTSTSNKPYVVVKDTPTGFLRVRSKPSSAGTELGQVQPGDQLPLLDSQSGWYLVEVSLPATSSGWISGQYATKSE